MLKVAILAGVIVSLVTGCSTLSGEESANIDRKATLQKLQTRCTNMLDSSYTPAGLAVDKTSESVLVITRRQCGVLNDYYAISENYSNVIAFLNANIDLNNQELKAAIMTFDEGKSEDKKIGPMIKAYETAQENIVKENLTLVASMAMLTTEMAIIAKNNAELISKEMVLQSGAGLLGTMMGEEKKKITPIVAAYYEMKERSELSYDAQMYINEEQNLVERIANIDTIIEQEVKA